MAFYLQHNGKTPLLGHSRLGCDTQLVAQFQPIYHGIGEGNFRAATPEV